MSAKCRKLPATFGPDTRFNLTPIPAAPYRALQESRFENLKADLLSARLEQVWEPELTSQVRRAANEAAALAWLTPYPLLMFPELFEEKTEAALAVAERQRQVRYRTRDLLAV